MHPFLIILFSFGAAADIIEFQLAHKATGALGSAYDRAQFIKQRHTMMQDWADYLDKVLIQSRTKVVALKGAK